MGVTGQGGRLLRAVCLIKPASKCSAVHRSTLPYFWKSLSPFTSFCMTTGILYGTVEEETLSIICANHGTHHVSNLTALFLEGIWRAGKSWELFFQRKATDIVIPG